MTNKGYSLIQLERGAEAVDVLKGLDDYAPAQEPFLRPLAQGLHNLALALDELGRHNEVAPIYERIDRMLRQADNDVLWPHHAWALAGMAADLRDHGNCDAAIKICDAILDRWWLLNPSTVPDALHAILANTIRTRADCLVALGAYDEAIADVDLVTSRYLSSHSGDVADEVAWAMVTKGQALQTSGHTEHAKLTFETVVQHYGSSTQPTIRGAVHAARRLRSSLEQPS